MTCNVALEPWHRLGTPLCEMSAQNFAQNRGQEPLESGLVTTVVRRYLSFVSASRPSVHPIEHDPTGRLREHLEAGYGPFSVGLENQAAKVARIELVLGSGIEDNRRLVALLDRQFSLFCR